MGRISISKETDATYPLEWDFIGEVERPLEDETWLIFDSEVLPKWERGAQPMHFLSIASYEKWKQEFDKGSVSIELPEALQIPASERL